MNESDNLSLDPDGGTIWSDLGIRELLARMRARKWMVCIIPFAWLIFSNLGFHFLGVEYSSELLVVPASLSGDTTQVSGISGALSSFGLDIGGAGAGADQNFSIYLESWTSSWFAEQLLANKPLTHRIFAGEWSERDQQWIRPSGVGSVVKPLVKSIFGGTPAVWSPPATEDMVSFLSSHVTETKVRGQVTTKISILLKDPELARKILQFGHASINAHLAELFRKRADQNVSYILGQLNTVSIAEYRQALLTTLAQVERTRMLAFSNPEFAASSLTLYVTANPVKPQASQIIAISLLGAIVLYLLLVFFADMLDLPVSASGLLRWAHLRR